MHRGYVSFAFIALVCLLLLAPMLSMPAREISIATAYSNEKLYYQMSFLKRALSSSAQLGVADRLALEALEKKGLDKSSAAKTLVLARWKDILDEWNRNGNVEVSIWCVDSGGEGVDGAVGVLGCVGHLGYDSETGKLFATAPITSPFGKINVMVKDKSNGNSFASYFPQGYVFGEV